MLILVLKLDQGFTRDAGQTGIRQPAAFLGLIKEKGGPGARHAAKSAAACGQFHPKWR